MCKPETHQAWINIKTFSAGLCKANPPFVQRLYKIAQQTNNLLVAAALFAVFWDAGKETGGSIFSPVKKTPVPVTHPPHLISRYPVQQALQTQTRGNLLAAVPQSAVKQRAVPSQSQKKQASVSQREPLQKVRRR